MLAQHSRLDVLRIIANPVRMKILEKLMAGERCVSDFEEFLGITQPNVSQHLSILRSYGVIDYYTDGRLKCYFLVDPLVPDLIALLKKEYKEKLPPPPCRPVTKKGKYPGTRE